MNQTNTIRKLKWMLMLTLLAGAGVANAATYYSKTFTSSQTVTFTQVTGTTKFTVNGDNTQYDGIGYIYVNTAGVTVNLKFNSGTFMLSDRIIVRRGRINISLNNETRNVTLKRASSNSNNYLFFIDNQSTTNYNDARLTIIGAEGHTIKIDGNASWTVRGSNSAGWEAQFTSGVKCDRPMFYVRAGRGDFNYVDFQNNWCTSDWQVGGFFFVSTSTTGNTPSKSPCYVYLDYCSFKNSYAEKQGAVMFMSGDLINGQKSYVRLRWCVTENCFCNANDVNPIDGSNTGGGIFRTVAVGCTDLVMTDCVIKNSKCKRSGMITWFSATASLTMTNDSIINNWSGRNGAGLTLTGVASIAKCKFLNNYAGINGGGIYFVTYGNSSAALPNFAPNNGSLEMDAQTEVIGNYAGSLGGGIYFGVSPINISRTGHGANMYTVFKNSSGTQYEVSLVVNGAKIMNNSTGGSGGGIFINRTTDIYKSDLKINYGTMENNNAVNDGGGFYVNSSVSGMVYGTCPYALTDLNVTIGSTSGTTQVVNNSAKNGGGGYITGTKHVTTINSGTIGTQAKPNRAIIGNGGGLCIVGGTVNVNGGNIQYNTATNNGGGFYVNTTGSFTRKIS